MSYILDALRKADADRERDPARGIHAQPVVPAPQSRGPMGPRTLVMAGGALAVVAAVLAWWFAGDAPPDPVAAAPTVAAPANAPAPVQVVQAAPEPAAPVPATPAEPPVPAARVLPEPPPMPVQAPAPAVPVLQVAAAPTAAPLKRPPLVPGAAQATPAVPASAPAASVPAAAGGGMQAAPVKPPAIGTPAERVFAVAELPADVQRELPRLVITGGVYSDNPAQRMLIVGGNVVNEGAEITAGLVLEQIRARTAVLRFRGWRYSVAY
jgi:general secretion pathway protein B